MELKDFFAQNSRAALAFSGGVDSAYLLYAAKKSGCDVGAYYVKTAFQPEFEYRDARRLAGELGVELRVLELDILADPQVAENNKNRCYYCKQRIMNAILRQAGQDGYPVLLDGTNASDEEGDRPGMRVLRELSVRSPLRECGLTKARIRQLSREAGLFTWDKPAYACLATRIPAGTAITRQMLSATETAEDFLAKLGFSDFRVRYDRGSAKLQIREDQMGLLVRERERILRRLREDYGGVVLDLETRGESL